MTYEEFNQHFTDNGKVCPIDWRAFGRLMRFMPLQEMLDAGLNKPHLTRLSFAYKEITSLEAVLLLRLISANTYITELDLSHNRISTLSLDEVLSSEFRAFLSPNKNISLRHLILLVIKLVPKR